MKYYLDEDLPYRAAEVARRAGVDVIASREANNDGAPDDVQLAYAAAQERVMVTRNAADFRSLTDQFQAEDRPHSGLLLVPPSLPNDQFWRIGQAIVAYDHSCAHPLPPYTVDWLRPPDPNPASAPLDPS